MLQMFRNREEIDPMQEVIGYMVEDEDEVFEDDEDEDDDINEIIEAYGEDDEDEDDDYIGNENYLDDDDYIGDGFEEDKDV